MLILRWSLRRLYGWSSRASNAALTWPALIAIAALVAAIATLTKAVSHHGLDNMTLQIVAAGTAFMLCGAGWWAMPWAMPTLRF